MELLAFGAYKTWWKMATALWGVEPLKLSTNPQPYSIERTIRWLTYQVANSLALVTEADKILQTEYMKMIQNSGRSLIEEKPCYDFSKLTNTMNTRKENDMEYKSSN